MRNGRLHRASVLVIAALLSGTVAAPDSPVADAARRGDVTTVKALLEKGADVNAAQGDGMTALHWAAERGDLELAGLLIRAGANVEAVTRIGSYTPLHLASKAGNPPIIRALLAAGSRVNATTTNSGATPLHFAAGSGSAEAVAALLDRGADANAREGSEWRQTPLMFAAASNGSSVIKVLLERGADPAVAETVVDYASRVRVDREAAERQEQALSGLQEPTAAQIQAAIQVRREAQNALQDAEYELEKDDSGRLVDRLGGTPVLIGKWGGLTALLHAARDGNADAVAALLDGGADIDQASGDGTSPLLIAVLNGQFDVAAALIERGANVNRASHAGVTPLYAAVLKQWAPSESPASRAHEWQQTTYLGLMEALLKAGADPNVRLTTELWYLHSRRLRLDLEGSTAFWRAAYAADVEALRLLARHGADPNIPVVVPEMQRGYGGDLFVQINADGTRSWVKRGDWHGKDVSGLPPVPAGEPAAYPIHAASGYAYGIGARVSSTHRHAPDGWLPSVKFLVEEMGADVNVADDDGFTPLHMAASRGDLELVRYLVSKGADVTAVSRTGETTADMANGPMPRSQVHPEVVALLESLGSKNNHRCMAGASPATCLRR